MIRLAVFILLSIFASSYCLEDDDLPILGVVGGNKAKPKQFPYQVSLEYSDRHKCGGSVISSTMILTAAHCTFGKVPEMFAIRVGTLKREQGGQLIKIKKYTNHPQYDDDTVDYDLAIMELETPIVFNDFIKPIQLPKENEKISVQSATASGWGQLAEEDYLLPKDLMFAELPLWNQKECANLMDATDRMMCAGHPAGGLDTCQSDSGGPLAARGKLIGVVSWGVGCGRPNSPGVFANVASLRSWIKEVSGV